MMRLSSVLCALALLAPTSAARAAGARPFVMPGLTPANQFGAELMLGTMRLFGDTTLLRLDLGAEFRVAPHYVITALLPIAYARIDQGGGNDEDGLGLGNLTAGFQFASASAQPSGSLLRTGLGVSLSLPTASDEGDAGTAAALVSFFYIPDVGRYAPNTTTVRLHGDLRRESADLFFQGQLGIDQLLIQDEEDVTLLRIGLAGGIAVSGNLDAVVELTTLSDILEGNDNDDDWVHVLDLGVRYQDVRSSIGGRLYLPLDQEFRDADLLGFGVDFASRF